MKRDVELLGLGEPAERVEGRTDAQVDLALDAGLGPVAAADRRPLLADVAAQERAVVG